MSVRAASTSRHRDEKLFEETRRHADAEHPDRYQDSELKTLIATAGYDVRNDG